MYKFLLIISLFLLLPITINAQIPLNISYPSFGGITPSAGMNFADLVVWAYYGIITFSTAAAFGMIIWGGMEYITSFGNLSKMSSGKEKIENAVIGLLIILISYLILQTINPQLLVMPQVQI